MSTLETFIQTRKRLKISSKELSLACGLHQNYVSRVERGEREYRHIYYLALLGHAQLKAAATESAETTSG